MANPREDQVFTKSLLVESVRQAVGLSSEQASAVVEAVFDAMIEELHRAARSGF